MVMTNKRGAKVLLNALVTLAKKFDGWILWAFVKSTKGCYRTEINMQEHMIDGSSNSRDFSFPPLILQWKNPRKISEGEENNFQRRYSWADQGPPQVRRQIIVLLNEAKYLWVILDSKLSWKRNMEYRVEKGINSSISIWKSLEGNGAFSSNR